MTYLICLSLQTYPEPLPESDHEPFEKLALTVRFFVKVMEHGPVPIQLPDHPENDQPFLGVAVNVTIVPMGYVPVQLRLGQLMPFGIDLIDPFPLVDPVSCGGGLVLLTVTVTDAVVFVLPAASRAIAVRVYEPFGTVVVFQVVL